MHLCMNSMTALHGCLARLTGLSLVGAEVAFVTTSASAIAAEQRRLDLHATVQSERCMKAGGFHAG